MIRSIASAVALALLAGCALVTSPGRSGVDASVTIASATAEVVRIIDGDTFVARLGGAEERIRLIGIDTPERREPDGPKATAVAKRLMAPGSEVFLVYDVERRDRYRRLLAYVWTSPPSGRADTAAMVNAEIMRLGWARTMTIPPNVAYADLFTRLQRQARTAKRGMWATEPFS